MTSEILVLAAHPDDETLGCGGTIAAHAAAGDRIHVVFLTEGVGARGASGAAAEERMAAARSACEILGAVAPVFLDFPDNGLDSVPLLQVVQSVERVCGSLDPARVYTHHAHDLNVDHRISHEAAMTVFRPQPGRPAPTILCFETPSSTEWRTPGPVTGFMPNWYQDIASYWDTKRRAMNAYAVEMRPWPHARSVEALEHLARWRGSCVGKEAAEAFMLARHIA